MAAKKCRNRACEWHVRGSCRLFPGEWGFLECRHADEKTEPKINTKNQKEN